MLVVNSRRLSYEYNLVVAKGRAMNYTALIFPTRCFAFRARTTDVLASRTGVSVSALKPASKMSIF